jgi:hypothetical protein
VRGEEIVGTLPVTARGKLRLWSGFDIRYPPGRGLTKRMSNPKVH